MRVYFDSRVKKMAADLTALRVELAASALAIALAWAMVVIWQPPMLMMLALAALVVIQSAARIGRARVSERRLLIAIGAADGFTATISRIEGACFGLCAAMIGLLGSSLATSSVDLTSSALWLVVATVVAAASASLAAESGW